MRTLLRQMFGGLLFTVGLLQTVLPGQGFLFEIPDGNARVGELVTIPLILDSSVGGDMTGWSFGICVDPAVMTVETVELGESVSAMLPPGPFINLVNIESGGYTVGIIFDPPFGFLPAGVWELSVATYTHQLAVGESTTVVPCNTLGIPPVETVAVGTNGSSVPGTLLAGTWTGFANPFVRGDVNDDGSVDLADGIFLLAELFAGGPAGLCSPAKDINGDGAINVADPVRLMNALFIGGPPPPAPFPDCGTTPDQTIADCVSYSSCP